MARTNVDLVNLTVNAETGIGANATTIDAALVTAGVQVDMGLDMRVLIYIENTFAGDKTVTIAGTDRYGVTVADKVITCAQDTPLLIGPMESLYYEQNGGKMYIDFETGFTGSILIVQVPKA